VNCPATKQFTIRHYLEHNPNVAFHEKNFNLNY
jgi:hypothetical protein